MRCLLGIHKSGLMKISRLRHHADATIVHAPRCERCGKVVR